MAVTMSDELFEQLVDRAVAQIPSDLAELVQNCVVVIESRAPEPDGDLLGFYDGVPLSERDSWYSGVLPDRIVIYRDAILDLCDSESAGGRRGAHHGVARGGALLRHRRRSARRAGLRLRGHRRPAPLQEGRRVGS